MLLPRRVKHRKVMRGRMSGQAKGGHYVAFGDYGLATLEPAWITSRQIEAARRGAPRAGGDTPARGRAGPGPGWAGWAGRGAMPEGGPPKKKPVTKKPAE